LRFPTELLEEIEKEQIREAQTTLQELRALRGLFTDCTSSLIGRWGDDVFGHLPVVKSREELEQLLRDEGWVPE
jgi:hypothetical protein